MILCFESGETKEDIRLLNTQVWETNHEGDGEAAKESILAAQPALSKTRRYFKGVIYKEWQGQYVTINKWKLIPRE